MSCDGEGLAARRVAHISRRSKRHPLKGEDAPFLALVARSGPGGDG